MSAAIAAMESSMKLKGLKSSCDASLRGPFDAKDAKALRKRATERKRMRLVAEVWSEIDQRLHVQLPRVPGRSDQHVPKK